MSLLTRCPACTTLYKVVPDQLRISQGWVKCGQCSEVFDASQHLMEVSLEPEFAVDSFTSSAAMVESDDSDQSAVDGNWKIEKAVRAEPEAQAEQQSENRPAVGLEPEVVSIPELTTEFATEHHSETESSPESLSGESLSAAASFESELINDQGQGVSDDLAPVLLESEPRHLTNLEPDASVPAGDIGVQSDVEPALPPTRKSDLGQGSETEATSPLASVSFMRNAGQTSARGHRLARSALSSLAGVLTLALGAQWIYRDHDRLAAVWPQWKPALESVCIPLLCSIEPWQQIESIAIDAAAFSKVGDDSYRLSFTLKNAAGMLLAWPSIELSLTDVQDRVVIRRVLPPSALTAPSDYLAARAELPVVVDLHIDPTAAASAIVGYRLLAFYP